MPEARATYELARLKRELKPFRLHWFPTLGSTNTHAVKLRRAGRLFAPSIVLTGNQTAGRGRGSNTWHSSRGIITATFALPFHDSLPPQHVPLVAGLAVRDAVASFGIESVGIKWPNDLWIDDMKLAGLLCERIDGIDLIGVGLNVTAVPPRGRLRMGATSVARHLENAPSISSVLIAVARQLHASLSDARMSLSLVLPRLRRHDVLANRKVCVVDGTAKTQGMCRGIDSQGRLRFWSGGKEVPLFTGTVSLAD